MFLFITKREKWKTLCAFHQAFMWIGVSFLPCVLVSQSDLYQNEEVCMDLQVLHHNCIPDSKNPCMHLGGVCKGVCLGGWAVGRMMYWYVWFHNPAPRKPGEPWAGPGGHHANQPANALWNAQFELAWRDPESCKIGCDAFLEIWFCFSFVGDCSVRVSFLKVAVLENN